MAVAATSEDNILLGNSLLGDSLARMPFPLF